jgi:ADP-ribose pyrophosphatase YjhB (NUDIX family)
MPETTDQAIQYLLESVPDRFAGLPQNLFYFVSQLTPMVNVDLLIKNNRGQTLLTWREDIYYGPAWHIPGGIVRFKETFSTRLHAVARHELGATIDFNQVPLTVQQKIHPLRDVRGHFISSLFRCELTSDPDPKKEFVDGAPQNGQWRWHDRAPENLLSVHDSFRPYIDGPY